MGMFGVDSVLSLIPPPIPIFLVTTSSLELISSAVEVASPSTVELALGCTADSRNMSSSLSSKLGFFDSVVTLVASSLGPHAGNESLAQRDRHSLW